MAPDPRGDQHAWFRSRLDAQAVGLLDQAEERLFLEHAAQCEPCGETLRAYSESGARLAREGHIPAALLARWDRTRQKLRGMARAMVREHLASCAECRQDLEAIGFKPELEVLPDEDAEDHDPVAMPVVPRRPATAAARAPSAWRPWLYGGIAGAGLATAATLMVVSTLRQPTPPEPDRGSAGAAATTTVPSFRLESLPGLVDLRDATRGAGSAITSIAIEADARYVVLGLPDFFLPDSTTLDLSIVGPDHAELMRSRYRYGDLFPRHPLLFGRPDAPLALGDYHLRVTSPFASSPEVADLRFRLVTRH